MISNSWTRNTLPLVLANIRGSLYLSTWCFSTRWWLYNSLCSSSVTNSINAETSSDANLGQCRHHVPTKTKGRILHSSNTSPKGVGMRTALIFYQVSSLKSTLASSCLFEFFFWRMWLPSMHLSLKGLVKQWMYMPHLPFKWKEENIQEGEAS